MPVKKEQKELLEAVRRGDIERTRYLLDEDFVDPDFSCDATTPLHEAVRRNDYKMVELLMSWDADPLRKDRSRHIALDLAEDLEVSQKIIKFLAKKVDDELAFQGKPPRKKRVIKKSATVTFNSAASKGADGTQALKITKENLPEIFSPENWTGKTQDMQQLWEKVPKYLKKDFDFAAALAGAQARTLQQMASPNRALGKNANQKRLPR